MPDSVYNLNIAWLSWWHGHPVVCWGVLVTVVLLTGAVQGLLWRLRSGKGLKPFMRLS